MPVGLENGCCKKPQAEEIITKNLCTLPIIFLLSLPLCCSTLPFLLQAICCWKTVIIHSELWGHVLQQATRVALSNKARIPQQQFRLCTGCFAERTLRWSRSSIKWLVVSNKDTSLPLAKHIYFGSCRSKLSGSQPVNQIKTVREYSMMSKDSLMTFSLTSIFTSTISNLKVHISDFVSFQSWSL
jgi:hypothetical protein